VLRGKKGLENEYLIYAMGINSIGVSSAPDAF
jgi:hypothetical protein